MSGHVIRTVILLTTFLIAVAFWIVFHIIFSGLIALSASPFTVVPNILAPVVLFALFVWFLTLTVIFVRDLGIRSLLYALIALAYVPIHWRDITTALSWLGIFFTLFLYDWLYREDINNQVKPQWGRTVLTAGTLPIVIFTTTISLFYFPLYTKNIANMMPRNTVQISETITSLGYFFVLQMFLVASNLLANFSVGTSMDVLMKIKSFSTLVVEEPKEVETPNL